MGGPWELGTEEGVLASSSSPLLLLTKKKIKIFFEKIFDFFFFENIWMLTMLNKQVLLYAGLGD